MLLNASRVYVGSYEARPVVYPDWNRAKSQELARESLDKYVADMSPDFVVVRDAWPKDETQRRPIGDGEFEYLPEVRGGGRLDIAEIEFRRGVE